eukprot:259939-Rhodomonas_salina.1
MTRLRNGSLHVPGYAYRPRLVQSHGTGRGTRTRSPCTRISGSFALGKPVCHIVKSCDASQPSVPVLPSAKPESGSAPGRAKQRRTSKCGHVTHKGAVSEPPTGRSTATLLAKAVAVQM